MPFVLTDEPTFTHDVDVETPVDGGFRKETMKVTYRVIEPDELESHDLSTPKGMETFLRAVVAEISGIIDGQKQKVPWSDAVFKQLLIRPWARRALWKGYFKGVNGGLEGN